MQAKRGENMQRASYSAHFLSLLTLLVTIGLVAPAFAADELLVVTYKQDLFSTNPHGKSLPIINDAAVEAACVAMAVAHNLQMGYAYQMQLPPGVAAWQPVAVFPSLGGVKLANERLLTETGLADVECPYSATASKSLAQMIRDFISAGGRLVICPLCWTSRGYDASDAFDGAELDQSAVPGLFLSAGKALDF
jgi:hypothetical protein